MKQLYTGIVLHIYTNVHMHTHTKQYITLLALVCTHFQKKDSDAGKSLKSYPHMYSGTQHDGIWCHDIEPCRELYTIYCICNVGRSILQTNKHWVHIYHTREDKRIRTEQLPPQWICSSQNIHLQTVNSLMWFNVTLHGCPCMSSAVHFLAYHYARISWGPHTSHDTHYVRKSFQRIDIYNYL